MLCNCLEININVLIVWFIVNVIAVYPSRSSCTVRCRHNECLKIIWNISKPPCCCSFCSIAFHFSYQHLSVLGSLGVCPIIFYLCLFCVLVLIMRVFVHFIPELVSQLSSHFFRYSALCYHFCWLLFLICIAFVFILIWYLFYSWF